MKWNDKSEKIFSRMVELRRSFHQYPELAFEEEKTAQTIMGELDRLGIPYEYSGVGSGVIARLGSNKNAPTVALRADMDGLPGEENTGLLFSSKNIGKMHVCGHDGHMAILLGAAALLKERPPEGNVLFVFQPAEEKGGGSRTIIKSGALKEIDAIFAGHITRHYNVGEIMISKGVITAQSDGFILSIKGKGGHGARPHEAVDSIVVTGLLIMAIQTLVSREINPVYPSVITIGKVEAGSSHNVIAEKATLMGTIRTTLPEVRKHIEEGLHRIADAIGRLHNAVITVEIRKGYPPVVNSDREADIAKRAALNVVGEKGAVVDAQ